LFGVESVVISEMALFFQNQKNKVKLFPAFCVGRRVKSFVNYQNICRRNDSS
jgi:hypothetical protein